MPTENVHSLFDDVRSPAEILKDAGEFLIGRQNDSGHTLTDLLFYYVGHAGFVPPDDTYCLFLRFTQERLQRGTSLHVTDLAEVFREHARHLRSYFVLDACFAGAARHVFQSSRGEIIRRQFPRKGVAILCSSSSQHPSKAPTGESFTMFTGALLSALAGGHPREEQWLSLRTLGRLTEDLIRERYLDAAVRPEVHSPDQRDGDLADVPLFPNLSATTIAPRTDPISNHQATNRLEKPGAPRGSNPEDDTAIFTPRHNATALSDRGSSPKNRPKRHNLGDIIDQPSILLNERLGPYVVRSFIGAGGSGLVFRALHTGTGVDTCLKLLYPVEDGAKAIFSTVSRGVRALNSIRDAHIIRITDSATAHFPDCSTLYLAMEFVDGEQLDVWSATLDQSAESFAKRLCIAYLLAISLSNAHTCRYIDEVGIESHGVVHGDLKPANIIVRRNGAPVILDFLLLDIHRLLDPKVVPAHLLASGFESAPITAASGTPGFMAPEQEAEGIVTVKTDIYGLGITFLHLFIPGTDFERMRELLHGSTRSVNLLRPLLLSMIAPSPESRPDNMASIADSLAVIAKALRIRMPRSEETTETRKRSGIWAALMQLFSR